MNKLKYLYKLNCLNVIIDFPYPQWFQSIYSYHNYLWSNCQVLIFKLIFIDQLIFIIARISIICVTYIHISSIYGATTLNSTIYNVKTFKSAHVSLCLPTCCLAPIIPYTWVQKLILSHIQHTRGTEEIKFTSVVFYPWF